MKKENKYKEELDAKQKEITKLQIKIKVFILKMIVIVIMKKIIKFFIEFL